MLARPQKQPWCAWCGNPLTQLRMNHRSRFCNMECRKSYEDDKAIEARRNRQGSRACRLCGNKGLSKKRAYYCSSECAKQAQRKSWRAYQLRKRQSVAKTPRFPLNYVQNENILDNPENTGDTQESADYGPRGALTRFPD